MIEVIVADKSPLVMRALVRLFEEDERFNLLATVNDGQAFLDLCQRTQFAVGVIGWEMPGVTGRCVLERLRGKPNSPRVVVHTGTNDTAVIRAALTLGAAGFCSKSDPPERLLDVCAAAAGGRMAFPFVNLHDREEDPRDQLTARERALLETLASGRTNAQLAREMGISVHTVKFHLKNVYDKLQVVNRAQAVALSMTGRREA